MVLSLPRTDANLFTVTWSPVTCFLPLGKAWIVGLTCNTSAEGKSQPCLLVKWTILLPRDGLARNKLSEPNWQPIGQWAQFTTAYKETWSVYQGGDTAHAEREGGWLSRSHGDMICRHLVLMSAISTLTAWHYVSMQMWSVVNQVFIGQQKATLLGGHL